MEEVVNQVSDDDFEVFLELLDEIEDMKHWEASGWLTSR